MAKFNPTRRTQLVLTHIIFLVFKNANRSNSIRKRIMVDLDSISIAWSRIHFQVKTNWMALIPKNNEILNVLESISIIVPVIASNCKCIYLINKLLFFLEFDKLFELVQIVYCNLVFIYKL